MPHLRALLLALPLLLAGLLPAPAAALAAAAPAPGAIEGLAEDQAAFARGLARIPADEDPVARTAAAALLAARRQAQIAGEALSPAHGPARFAAPSEAAFALLARHGAAADAEQRADILALDALPGGQAEALAGVIEAFLGFEGATAHAWSDGDAPTLAAMVPILAARERLLLAALDLHEAASPSSPSASAPAAATCVGLLVAPALSLETAGCPSTHTVSVVLRIDWGGADSHLANNGGTRFCPAPAWPSPYQAAAHVDLGGNDLYRGNPACDGWTGHASGINGGAYEGSGFLLDVGGSDQYVAGGASNGGGSYATGFLADTSGDDSYYVIATGNGGVWAGGYGLLVDGAGNDLYEGNYGGVNGGADGAGAGMLLDLAGDDRYEATSKFGFPVRRGVNGGTPYLHEHILGVQHGVALLYDGDGQDSFLDPYYACANAASPTCTLAPKGSHGAIVDVNDEERTLWAQADLVLARARPGADRDLAEGWDYAIRLLEPAGSPVNATRGTVLSAVNGALAHPTVRGAQDTDADGTTTQDEILSGRSDPAAGGSRPTSDEDGDGVQNRDEQTRAHAMGLLVHPTVRVTAADRAWVHFPAPGATAALVAPTGATLRLTYLPPPGAPCGASCPAVVAEFDLSGQVVAARLASNPAVLVPAAHFRASCTPSPFGPTTATACLLGAGADGSWLLRPAQQQGAGPAGMRVSIGGKTYDDVAPASGDIATTGTGQANRDPTMPARVWNWREQPAGTTHAACSGGLASPCATEAGQREHPFYYAAFLAY